MTSSVKSDRPNIPSNYGISRKAQGMMQWEWAEAQLVKSRSYWICTTRPDGRPHAAPVWGVWLEGALYFGSGRATQRARNLAAKPQAVVHLESGDEVVILEGKIEEVNDMALLKRIADDYSKKYSFQPNPEKDWVGETAIFRFTAHKALGWLEADYPNTATRWHFK